MKSLFTLLKTTTLVTPLLLGQAYAATAFSPERQPLGYIGPIELSDTDLSSGGAKAYRGWFENGGWQGDLIEYNVSSSGGLTTSIDLSGLSPQAGGTTTNWSAHVQFATSGANANYWDTGRKIIIGKGTTQDSFRWNRLSASQQQAIDLNAFNNGDTFSNIVNFVRGERSNEFPATLGLRRRFSLLGDIVHSNPEYVGKPESDIIDSSYVSFVNANSSRAPRVYVGSNDGMLHAFDAASGDEVWAYIPSMVIEDLAILAGRPYTHEYYVDGGITVQDSFFNSAWHTALVGSLGAGGKGLFGLDVTSPGLSSEGATTGADKKVLWELDGSDDDMGYIFGTSTITRLNDGKWYAVNGNGVSSVNGIAKLYLVNIETGVVTKISTGSGSSGSPNGLAAPALVDINNDGKADIAYAGDIDGVMWKFDLSSTTSGSWNVAYRLYDGLTTQPITQVPDVSNHPQFGHLVLFGTGRLYTAADITDASVQAMYGIWDTGSAPGGGTTRLAQLLSADTDYVDATDTYGETVRTFTTTVAIDWASYEGWKVDLPAGERLLTSPQIRAGRVKTTITNPDGFSNWLFEMSFDEGGVADNTIYDLDRSGVLDTADRVDNNADSDLDDLEDIPMAWQRETGNMSQPTIARIAQGFDTLFINFLNPPLVPPSCTGNCAGGLDGGHVDVDTDSAFHSGLGGQTDGHQHEYDDVVNRTYVDYFDIDPPELAGAGGKVGTLRNVDEVGIANNEEFIVLVANADLSPGGELVLGNKAYNVVEYQRMIHKKLAVWDSVGPLLDDDGDSLIHTLPSIQSAGGTLRSTFNSRAIIDGGLHPTIFNCVIYSPAITNDRWRNGALLFQLVERNLFAAGTPPLDRLRVQNPSDLRPVVNLADGTQVELTEDLNANSVIDPATPDYEVYGGLTINSNADFLYESALFWHYDGACYGQPTWEVDVAIATNSFTQELYDELLLDAGFPDITALIARLDALEALGCDSRRGGTRACRREYRELVNLRDLGELINNSGSGGGGGGGGGGTGVDSISGDPVVIEGGIAEGGLTSGPNFETGRRTWTDILPQ